jgi:hypothetical protein
MTRHRLHPGNSKPIVGSAITGLAFAALFCKLEGATVQGCCFVETVAWVALEVLRPLILAAWPSVPSYLLEDARLLQHLVQFLASLRPLLCLTAG